MARRGHLPLVDQRSWDLRVFLLMTCNIQGREESAREVSSTWLTRLDLPQDPHSSFTSAFPPAKDEDAGAGALVAIPAWGPVPAGEQWQPSPPPHQ